MAHKEAIEELESQIEWLKEQLNLDAPAIDHGIIFGAIMGKQEKLVELKANKGKEL